MKPICFAILTLSLFVSSAYSVPPVINYAGQVAVDGEGFDGNGLFKFAIVNDSGSTTYWSNDGSSTAGSEPTASVSVSVNGGLYSVLLGNSAIQGMNAIDPAVFQQHGDSKLRVWFNDGTNGFQQLTPDRSFASVPYALSAGSAESANIAPGSINGSMLATSLLADLNGSMAPGSIIGSMLAPSLLADLNSSISDGSVSTSKMDPNLVRYFIPEISANPAAVTVIQGTGTILAVQATGKFLSYQWQKNGAYLSGETNASLVLNNVNASEDDANYSVVISNDWGNVTTPLARVTVATAQPTITVLGSATLVHEAATAYTDAGATAVDALGGDLTSAISITSADINVTSVSQQVVTYSVTDTGGNANTVTRTVTVQDTTAPILTLIGDSNFTHNLNTAWMDPGYNVNDTLDGNLTNSVYISGIVDVNTTGTYTLNYSVSDAAGNQTDVNRTVNVAEIPQGPWTFTNAGATGRLGPTQSQIDANYSGTSLEGAVTINSTHQGIQEWTVPANGTFRIEALGAKGGGNNGGLGAKLIGDFGLLKSETLKIVVGQQGSYINYINSTAWGAGGGGGTFVFTNSENLFLAAGGGGGQAEGATGGNGSDSNLTTLSIGGKGNGSGGINGNGGAGGINIGNYSTGGGGAGWISNGQDGLEIRNPSGKGGFSPNNGSIGGEFTHASSSYSSGNAGDGGFGGGGSMADQTGAGGGGGGYNGGGGGNNYSNPMWGAGGGGGSYNSGTNQDNNAGANEGHGKVIITYVGN